MRIDHVLLTAAPGFERLPGGRHPGMGTANEIVPLGDTYLELMRIVDEDEAAHSLFGRLAAARSGFLGFCVGTDDLDAVCARLGLEAFAASRVRPDGVELRWRLAGVAEAVAEPGRPFFIEWDVPPEAHPGRSGPPQGELVAVESPADLRDWLGGAELPILRGPGGAAVRRPGSTLPEWIR